MNKIIHGVLGALLVISTAQSPPASAEFKLELGAPIKNANLSGQCPRYKISNKPALMPRYKCRFS